MKMKITYRLPGKERERITEVEYEGGMINAFRKLFAAHPDAEPTSFDGRKIMKTHNEKTDEK